MRPSKIEWLIEKGTELGVDHFVLYPSQNQSGPCHFSPHQQQRFTLISIAALKQSGRLFLPSLNYASSLQILLEKTTSPILYADPTSETTIQEAPFNHCSDEVWVTGPEEGFATDELSYLQAVGLGYRLGPYILRAETAPMAIAAIRKSIHK
jgi:16S rRNA (uracil1498-N3)-methyltransferase